MSCVFLQEAAPLLDPKSIPPIVETDDLSRKKCEKQYKIPTAEMIAYLDFNVSTTGVLSGVKVQMVSGSIGNTGTQVLCTMAF